jgi:hypothetical protein
MLPVSSGSVNACRITLAYIRFLYYNNEDKRGTDETDPNYR